MSAPPVVLLGLSGSGKSTVGRLLAQLLGGGFTDVDALVEAESGARVAEVFALEGESGFRRREARALAAALASGAVVVAAGAGLLETRACRQALREAGALTVWLRVPPAVCAERLREEARDRPLLAEAGPAALTATLERLEALRRDRYAAAQVHLDATEAPERVARRLAAAVLARRREDDA